MAQKEKILDKAQKLLQKGQMDKALAEYRSAFDLDPRDISIRLRIGDLFVKMGRNQEAVKEYTEVAKANAQRGFYLKAIAVYKQVLKLDETSIDVHNKLAELYVKQRLIADAISEYSYIVSVLERKGRTSDVMDLLKKMVETDSENIGVRMKLADLFLKLSFEKDAIAEYVGICERLLAQGKPDKAEKVYLNLYNSGRKDVKVLKGLSEIYKARAEQAQFLKFARQLFDSYVEKADTESAREMAYAILEAYPEDKESIKYLEQFVPKMPEPPRHEEPRKEEHVAIEPQAAPKEAEPVIEFPKEAEEKPMAQELPPDKPEWEEEIEITLEGFEEEAASAAPEEAQKPEPQPIEAQKEEAPEEPLLEKGLEEEVHISDETAIPPSEAEVNIEIPGEERITPAPEHGQAAQTPVEAPLEAAAEAEVEIPVGAGIKDASLPIDETAEVSIPVEEAAPVPAEEAMPRVEEPAEPALKEEPLIAAPPELESVAEEAAPEKAEEAGEKAEEAVAPESAQPEVTETVVPSQAREEEVIIDIPQEMEPLKEEPPAEISEAGPLDEALKGAVDAIEALEEKAQKESEPVKEVEPLIEEPVFVEEAPAASAQEAVAEERAEEQVIEETQTREVSAGHEETFTETPVVEEKPAAVEMQAAEERPPVEETRFGAGPPPVEETLKEELPPAPAPTAEAEARAEDEISEAITELLEKMEPEEQLIEADKAGVEGGTKPPQAEEYVDLTAELGMEEAAHDMAESWGREEPKETFDEFRSGIGKQLSKEDTETHYNLGIAYMEMELHSEAAKEFKIALKDPRLEFDCYTRLGLCAMAENNPHEAVVYYLKGLKIENKSDDERKGMMYELALAYEAAGNMDEATQIFGFIQSMDPKFRDVSRKVREYGERRPLIPLDDGLIEVELL